MSGAKENVIGQFLLKWVDLKMAVFQTSSEFDETVLLGPYRQNKARFIFLEFFDSVCGPGKLKCTFKLNIECFIF